MNGFDDHAGPASASRTAADQGWTPPRATYRLQLTRQFPFAAATDLAPYLARLGISHLYLSPILMARPGSTHAYDVVDHDRINPELGTEDDFARMAAAFRRRGIGILLDIVPNHMGTGPENPRWMDLLPHRTVSGQCDCAVRTAPYFKDILGGEVYLSALIVTP